MAREDFVSETIGEWRFDDVRVDGRAGQVWKGDRLVELEPKAFDLLCHLASRPGALVSKQDLLDAVWKGVAVTDNALTRVVAQLRKALGDDSRQARYIETVPTRGYRFIAEVTRSGRQASTGPASPEATTQPTTQAPTDGATDGATGAPTYATSGPPRRRATDHPDPDPLTSSGLSETIGAKPLGASAPVQRWQPIALLLALAVAVVLTGAALWSGARPASLADDAASAGGRFELTRLEQTTYAIAMDGFPTFSPDGAAIAFASNRDGRFEIFARAFASGSDDRRITSDGQQNIQPDWSPDGSLIAYHSLTRGGIWIVPATGGTSRQIAEAGSSPRWSPDGQSIAYQSAEIASVDETGALPPSVVRIVSLADGQSRDVTQPGQPVAGHGQPVWTPDGRRIVFISNSTREAELWTVDVASSAATRLMACPRHCRNPLVSADGAWLYFSTLEAATSLSRVRLAPDGAATVGPVEGTPVAAGPHMQGLSMSRDGTRLAFGVYGIRSSLQTVPLAADGGAAGPPRPLTRDTSRRNAWPSFSADGGRLVFTSWRPGQGHQVWLANADGSQPQQITDGRVVNMAPGWLAGDREVAFQSKQEAGMTLRAVDLSTRRVRDLLRFGEPGQGTTAQYAAPRLMGGRYLLYGRHHAGLGNIWMTDLDTRAVRQLTQDPALAGFPVGSRDGRWVAYEAYRGADMQLAIVPFDGGDARILTSGRGLTWPNDFSPDTTRIVCAYRRDGVWNIGWVPRDGGALRPLTTFTNAAGFVRYPAWSPANDQVVFEQAEFSGNIWVGQVGPDAQTQRERRPDLSSRRF